MDPACRDAGRPDVEAAGARGGAGALLFRATPDVDPQVDVDDIARHQLALL